MGKKTSKITQVGVLMEVILFMGNENIVVPLYRQEVEEYEKKEQNIISVSVIVGQEDISDQCEVVMEISKNALIGFATETLRIGDNFEFDRKFHRHLDSLGTSYSNQSLGFFLTDTSTDMVMYFEELGNLKDYGFEKSIQKTCVPNKEKVLHLEYLISKIIDNEYLETFQLGFENIAELNVIKNGEKINKKCIVVVKAGKYGILGLGTEFIRLAHHFEEGNQYEVNPLGKETLISNLGIFLTPKSSKLTIRLKNLKNVFYYDPNFGTY